MYIPSYITDKRGLKQYVRKLCLSRQIPDQSLAYYVLKDRAIRSFDKQHRRLIKYHLSGGNNYPILVRATRVNFFTALIADQIHDFLARDKRSELIQASGIDTVEKLVYIWQKVGIDMQYRHRKQTHDRYTSIVKLSKSRDGKEKSSQRVAELLLSQLKSKTDITPIGEFTALSVMISQKLSDLRGDLGKIKGVITTEASYDQTKPPEPQSPSQECSPFQTPIETVVRTLLPEEFNCYKSLIVEYGKLQEDPREIKNINIVVDATKEKDSTLTNTLIAESAPNEICRKYRSTKCHLGSVVTQIEKILPNDFDKAKEDALIPFQRNLANKFVHSTDNHCNFQLTECTHAGAPLPNRDIMKWSLIRLPNALQVLFNLAVFPIDILSDSLDEAVTKNSFLNYFNGVNPEFTTHFFDGLKEASKDEALDYRIVNKAGGKFWCDILLEEGVSKETRRSQLYGLIDSLQSLDGAREFHSEFKLADRSLLSEINLGCEFYREHVSILHKLQYLKNDLKSLFNRIRQYFKVHCNYGWKEIFDDHRAWLKVKIESLKDKITETHHTLLKDFVEDNRTLGQDSYYTFMVEGAEELTTTCTFTHLAVQWWFYLWFLHDKYSFRKDVFENLIVQRVVCKDIKLHKTDFSSDMVEVSCYLANQTGFGPSVGNVGNFLEEIRYLFVDEFECTATIHGIQKEDDWVTISRNKDSTNYKIILKGRQYELPQIAIIYLFMQGYIAALEFTKSYTLADGSEQGFEGSDREFQMNLEKNPQLARYYFLAMISKTLCDLSISSWCASANQTKSDPNTTNLFFTFDRTAASISTMLYGMSPFTLFQKEKALFIPTDNPLFKESALMETGGFKTHCLLEDSS